MIAIAVIWFTLVLAWDLFTDYMKWIAAAEVKHKSEAWLRAALLTPTGVLLTIHNPWWIVLIVIPMIGFTWMALFNGLYNRLRGYPWLHSGTTAWTDKLLTNREWLPIPLAVVFIISYIFAI